MCERSLCRCVKLSRLTVLCSVYYEYGLNKRGYAQGKSGYGHGYGPDTQLNLLYCAH